MLKNRIRHLLADWPPDLPPEPPRPTGAAQQSGALPDAARHHHADAVERCINRDLLVTLVSASLREIHRHQRATPSPSSEAAAAHLEAMLRQPVEDEDLTDY
jgi:hypothetical protein